MATYQRQMLLPVNDYDINIRRILGRGAFGIVYKGFHNNTKEPIAAKNVIYKDENQETNDFLVNMGKNELAIFHQLQGHPNVVQLLTHVDDGESHWLLMEFCDLGDLQVYMNNKNLNLAMKLKIMYECVNAVTYMHSFQPPIVHRDIKPQNVLMIKQGSFDVAKITDFGIGKLFESNQVQMHETMTTLAGTAAYMAPEFFMADGEYLKYKAGVDVFSLGLLYHVILAYSKDNQELRPMSVEAMNSKIIIHYGLEMSQAVKNNLPLPKLFENPTTSNQSQSQQIQNLIIEMTKFKEKDRLKPVDVKSKIKDIASSQRGKSLKTHFEDEPEKSRAKGKEEIAIQQFNNQNKNVELFKGKKEMIHRKEEIKTKPVQAVKPRVKSDQASVKPAVDELSKKFSELKSRRKDQCIKSEEPRMKTNDTDSKMKMKDSDRRREGKENISGTPRKLEGPKKTSWESMGKSDCKSEYPKRNTSNEVKTKHEKNNRSFGEFNERLEKSRRKQDELRMKRKEEDQRSKGEVSKRMEESRNKFKEFEESNESWMKKKKEENKRSQEEFNKRMEESIERTNESWNKSNTEWSHYDSGSEQFNEKCEHSRFKSSEGTWKKSEYSMSKSHEAWSKSSKSSSSSSSSSWHVEARVQERHRKEESHKRVVESKGFQKARNIWS